MPQRGDWFNHEHVTEQDPSDLPEIAVQTTEGEVFHAWAYKARRM